MIFKKQISIFLAFFLLVSNLGLAFNVHYCDNEIASVSINSFSNSFEIEKDCCGVVEKESKCCHNKIIKAQEKSDQIIVKKISFNPDFIVLFNDWKPIVSLSNAVFQKRDLPAYCCDANAPPLYLLYNQFTFYA